MLTLYYLLCYTLTWFIVSVGSWYLVRLLMGRTTFPVTMKEFLFVLSGCFLSGLLPFLFILGSPDGEWFILYYVLLGGTFFGALCGESCWLCLGD